MLIVKPIEDKAQQEEFCKKCGAHFDAEFLACSAHVSEELVGICQFEFKDGKAILHDIRQKPGVDDFEAMFIMTRGTLNFIDLCGYHTAVCNESAGDVTLIKAAGFKETDDGFFEMDLTDAFTSKCDHCK